MPLRIQTSPPLIAAFTVAPSPWTSRHHHAARPLAHEGRCGAVLAKSSQDRAEQHADGGWIVHLDLTSSSCPTCAPPPPLVLPYPRRSPCRQRQATKTQVVQQKRDCPQVDTDRQQHSADSYATSRLHESTSRGNRGLATVPQRASSSTEYMAYPAKMMLLDASLRTLNASWARRRQQRLCRHHRDESCDQEE
ncbi:hypothetical protein ACP70R_038815 [Stipagrostis hirtigluma subsp. patula]